MGLKKAAKARARASKDRTGAARQKRWRERHRARQAAGVVVPRAGATAGGDDEFERRAVRAALEEVIWVLRTLLDDLPSGVPDPKKFALGHRVGMERCISLIEQYVAEKVDLSV